MVAANARNLVVKSGVHEVYYTAYRSQNPGANEWIVMHHGICHTRAHFLPLIRALNRHGVNVAMVEQFVKGSWLSRNLVGMDRYREGMKAAVERIRADITSHDLSSVFLGYVCHSMGGMICEEMQHAHPALRMPTIYMTPIPVNGALPVSLRIIRRHLAGYIKAVFSLSVLSLLNSPKMARELLFDGRTPESLVRATAKHLVPTSFFAYCQLTTRFLWPIPFIWLTRPKKLNDHGKKMLFLSATDEIFYPWELKKTRRLYPQIEEEHFKGGHNFFMQYAKETAVVIDQFFASVRGRRAAPAFASTAKPQAPPAKWRLPDGVQARVDGAQQTPPQSNVDGAEQEREKVKDHHDRDGGVPAT